MPEEAGLKWDRKYRSKENLSGRPAHVLASNLAFLPKQGAALDLACGLGGNAILLAEKGLNTTAWDISRVALAYLEQITEKKQLNISTAYRDVVTAPPEPDCFDVIVVSNFLERAIVPKLIAALKPNGLIYYQTFTREGTRNPSPSNPHYKLDVNELLQMFATLTVRFYREAGNLGGEDEFEGIAMIVAQKPAA